MSDRIGNMLRRWSLEHSTGAIGCYHDAVDIRAMSAEDIAAIEAHNALMHETAEALSSYEAALRISEPDEPHEQPVYDEDGEEIGTEPTPAYAAYTAAQAVIAGTSDDVIALHAWRQGEPERLGEDGEDTAEWTAWNQARQVALSVYGNAPEITVPTEAEVARASLPNLSPRQIRLVMLAIGLTDEDVETQIAAIPDEGERAAALIEWRHATQYRRLHPLVVSLLAAMQFDAAEADDLWAWAVDI